MRGKSCRIASRSLEGLYYYTRLCSLSDLLVQNSDALSGLPNEYFHFSYLYILFYISHLHNPLSIYIVEGFAFIQLIKLITFLLREFRLENVHSVLTIELYRTYVGPILLEFKILKK